MWAAKARGLDSYEFYEPAVAQRLDVEQDLRMALQRGELLLHHQPIVELADGTSVDAEALLRWMRAGLAPLNSLVTVNGYLDIPLTGPGGELFGTLCAVDPEPFDDAVVSAQPLFELQARLLSSLLSVELLAAARSRRAEAAERSAWTTRSPAP